MAKVRRTLAERKAEMREKLAKLEAQALKEEIAEKISNGECADPEAAKGLQKELRYLTAARKTMEKYGLCDAAKFGDTMGALEKALEAAVNGS